MKIFGIGIAVFFILMAFIPTSHAEIIDWSDLAAKKYADLGGHLVYLDEGWYGFYRGPMAYLTVEGPGGDLMQYFFWPGHMHVVAVDPSTSGY